jgi:hypothetical protein
MLISARYVMLGGFLGAGKPTAILKLARWSLETVLGQLNGVDGEFTMALFVRHSAAFRPARPTPTHRVGHG